jgi:hypothetical protein
MKEIVPSPPPIVRNQFEAIRELFSKNVVPSYGRFDLALSHGCGSRLFDVNGKSYLLELPLRADFALVQAFLADYLGNLGYVLTARNFNPVIALAAGTVIACADNIVPVGLISASFCAACSSSGLAGCLAKKTCD